MTSIAQDTFARCVALLFAPDRQEQLVLADLARKLGFGHVLDFRQLNTVPAQSLPFYLLHHRVADHIKLRLLRGLRSTDDLRRKYAPIVCVIPHGPRHQMVPLVEMGFDEVVFLGDGLADIAQALSAQLGHELLYIEAPNYFGPDRRRLERISRGDPRRHQGGTLHHRIQVVRDPELGIRATYLR